MKSPPSSPLHGQIRLERLSSKFKTKAQHELAKVDARAVKPSSCRRANESTRADRAGRSGAEAFAVTCTIANHATNHELAWTTAGACESALDIASASIEKC